MLCPQQPTNVYMAVKFTSCALSPSQQKSWFCLSPGSKTPSEIEDKQRSYLIPGQ